jgi:hypothetical protein
MSKIMDFPAILSVLSFMVFCFSVYGAASYRKKWGPLGADERDDLSVVQGAAFTLLGLLVGFTFSMAISRYEQRKSYEEAEANAIGTEYVRVDLLPATDAPKVRELLKKYLDQRVLFYTTRDDQLLQQIDTHTAQLQNEMWSATEAAARTQPTPISALAVAGMNDVLNSQGYTQAAWWNRIPVEAWFLLAVIAAGCNLLFGYGAHRPSILFVVLPLAVAVSFFLIADIDSPRGGLIRVRPQNLVSLSQSLSAN